MKRGEFEMKKKTEDNGNKLLSILIGVLFALVLGLIGYKCLFGTKTVEETVVKKDVDFSGVTSISELATVRSYYHNVATLEKQPDGWYQYGWGKVGYKKAWIEYTGTVELGIDFSKVQIDQPDDNNVVKVYVPEAKVLNINADEDSISDPIVETGTFTKVTTDDLSEMFTAAQTDMEESIETDSNMLQQAEIRAKELIKEFILNIGELQGETYTVKFVGLEEVNTNE